jgi:hypothetical protein
MSKVYEESRRPRVLFHSQCYYPAKSLGLERTEAEEHVVVLYIIWGKHRHVSSYDQFRGKATRNVFVAEHRRQPRALYQSFQCLKTCCHANVLFSTLRKTCLVFYTV